MNRTQLKYMPLNALLHLMALLPLRVLYIFADIAYLLLLHVIRYRRKVIDENLRGSFPDKSPEELRRIKKKFYRNFADQTVETIKLLHISDSSMKKRMIFDEAEIARIDALLAEKRPVVAFFSHCFNWEWAPSITLWSSHRPSDGVEFCQIYRPLRNQWFDSLMLKLRSRFGAVSLPKRRAFLDLLRYRKNGVATITGFMSDQHPSHGDPGYITDFLHHPTAIITGTETVARRLDAVVVYWDMYKLSRGHYKIRMVPVTDSPASLPEGEITLRYANLLQTTILRDPALWLWSHNRWKNPVTLSEKSTESNPDNNGK